MDDHLSSSVELLEGALARAADLAEEEDLRPIRRLIDDIRARPGYLGKTLVVAIAGGTGTGKSSLLNALAGATISAVGPLRPTTDRPVAWVPSPPTSDLSAFLDLLGVEERVEQDNASQLAIVDMPDYDSVDRSHRLVVQELLGRVDVVIWVVDPEKYNDRVLHREFLDVFVRYQAQFAFVLNQIDLLSDPPEVASDWERLLVSGGIVQPTIILTAARPRRGAPVGIYHVRRWIDSQLEAKQTASVKLAADLLHAADLMAEVTGAGPGSSLGFEAGWLSSREGAAMQLATRGAEEPSPQMGVHRAVASARHPFRSRQERRSDGITQATRSLTGFVSRLGGAAGARLGSRIRMEFPPDRIRHVCTQVAASLDPVPEARSWARVGLVQISWGAAAASLGLLMALGGEAVAAVLTASLGLGGVLGAEAWIRSTGAEAGRTAAAAAARSRRQAEEMLERELGTALRTVVRPRAELSGILTKLGIEAARIGSG